MYLRTGTI